MSDPTDATPSPALPARFPFSDPPQLSQGPLTVLNVERRTPGAKAAGGDSSPAKTPGGDGPSAVPPSAVDSELGSRLFPQEYSADVSRGSDLRGSRLDHFELQERIGIGGMGTVFKAADLRLNRIVALKVLSPSQSRDSSATQRFLHEAQAGARLDHENIARVFYIGQDRGLHFIAFEYVTGTNLRDLIRANGRLRPAEAVNITLQVASALRQTNALGVVHRDIKPSNIIITGSGRVKLVDLGLARSQTEEGAPELTTAGTTLGTFDYISPEQARDPRNVDVRSDIYSLGCTLYHMLTGEPPYPEGTVLQKLLDHQGGDAPDPAAKNRQVPAALSAVVRKMMSSDPRRRYPTPEALIQDLLVLAAQFGLQASNPDGLVWTDRNSRAGRFWERHLPWMLTASILLVLVFALDRYPQLSQKVLSSGESVARAPKDSRENPVASRGGTDRLVPSPDAIDTPGASGTNGFNPPGPTRPLESRTRAGESADALVEFGTSETADSLASNDRPASGGSRSGDPLRPLTEPSAAATGSAAAPGASSIAPSIFEDGRVPLLTNTAPIAGDLKIGKPAPPTNLVEFPREADTRGASPSSEEVRSLAAVTTNTLQDVLSPGVSARPELPGRSLRGPLNEEPPTPRAGASATPGTESSADTTPRPGDARLPLEAKTLTGIVVLPLNGGEPRAYPTLESACTQAEDGQIVELRYQGTRGEPEKPLRISGKKITIRGGKGFRPVVEFVIKDSATPGQSNRMMSLSGGALELSHLDVRLTIADQFAVKDGDWAALVSLTGAEQIRMQGVTVTVVNPSARPVAVLEVAPPPGQAMSKMKMMAGAMPVERPRFDIKIIDSLIRGNADVAIVRQTYSGQMELEQSALSIDGSVLALLGGAEPASPEASLRLNMEHVTALVGNGLIRMDSGDLPRELLPVSVNARNNVVASRTPAPLIVMVGTTNAEDFRRMLRWHGEKNFYDRFDLFWTITTPQGISDFDTLDFDGWKKAWSAVPDTSEVGAVRGNLGWKSRWWERLAREATLADFEIQRDGTSAAMNAATDGSDVGIDFNRFNTTPVTP